MQKNLEPLLHKSTSAICSSTGIKSPIDNIEITIQRMYRVIYSAILSISLCTVNMLLKMKTEEKYKMTVSLWTITFFRGTSFHHDNLHYYGLQARRRLGLLSNCTSSGSESRAILSGRVNSIRISLFQTMSTELSRWLLLAGLLCYSSCQSVPSSFENQTGECFDSPQLPPPPLVYIRY